MNRQAIEGGWSMTLAKAVVLVSVLFLGSCGDAPDDNPCGDGVLNAGEQCDDGNRGCGDGCNHHCVLEPTRCSYDSDCGSGEYCGAGGFCSSCSNSCALNGHCWSLAVCTINEVCASIQCTVDADCNRSGEFCSNGRCFPLLCADARPLDCAVATCPDGGGCGFDPETGCVCGAPCEEAFPPDCAEATCMIGQQCVVQGSSCVCLVPLQCADALPTHCAVATCPDGGQCVLDPQEGCVCVAPSCENAVPPDCAGATCPGGQQCVLDKQTKSCVCDVIPQCADALPFNCAGAACPAGQQCVLDPDKMCVCGDASGSAASSGHFVYGVNPNPSFSIGSDGAGQSPNHELTFDVTAGELETFRAVLIYPAAFGFNGFSTLGPTNTQVGNYAFDLDFDGTPEFTVPVRVLTDDAVYADLFADAVFVSDYEPTIEHTGAHGFVVTLPHGGDSDSNTITAPLSLRVSVEFFAGILTNPLTPGLYTLNGHFVSVDPDTDGFDDGLNNSPLMFSAELEVNIVASSCNVGCVWDVDFSGQVRVPDLIKLLSCWGPLTGDPDCTCLDIDGSGDVRVPDLIALLAKWGLCP